MPFCQFCGNKMLDSDRFCSECGGKVDELFLQQEHLNNNLKEPTQGGTKRRTRGLIIAIVALSVMVICVISLLVVFILKKNGVSATMTNKDNYLLYCKDINFKDVTLIDLKTDHELYRFDIDFGNSENLDVSGAFAAMINLYPRMSNDGNRLFYFGKNDSGKTTLICKKLSGINKDPIEIDAKTGNGVYTINNDGTMVVYTDENKNLCQFDVDRKTKETIDKVDEFYVSEDGMTVYYVKNNELYSFHFGRKTKLIATKINTITYISKDYQTIYFTKNIKDSGLGLFKITKEKDEELISSGIHKVLKVYDTGEIYFLTEDEDAVFEYSIYYYDGKTNTMLSNRYSSEGFSAVFAADVPTVVYQEYTMDEYSNNIFDTCIAVREKPYVISEAANAELFMINSTGTTLYYINRHIDSFEGEGEDDDDGEEEKKRIESIYRVSITKGDISEPEVFDSNVSVIGTSDKFFGGFIDDNLFAYYKNYDSSEHNEFYINKNKIDENVSYFTDPLIDAIVGAYKSIGIEFTGIKNSYYIDGMFYYLTSEDGKQTRSLKRYDGESVVEIAKDIRQFNVLPKGYVFYERNFKPETNERDLYEWHDGNTRKIDDGIVMYTFYIR